MLTPYLPYPLLSGGQIRTYNLLKNLSKKHEITLVSYIRKNGERQYLPKLKQYCHDVKVFNRRPAWHIKNILAASLSPYPLLVTLYLSRKFQHAIKKELQTKKYDLIHAETFYMMPNIPKTHIPILLAEQTIEYLAYQNFAQSSPFLPFKPFLYLDVYKIKYWEKQYWKQASRLITMSQEDKDFIIKELRKEVPIDVVANGVDIAFFSKTKKNLPQNPTVLFVGTFKWLPNKDAVEFLVEKIWPKVLAELPTAKLLIVGFSPSTKIQHYAYNSSISVKGNVSDIREAYGNSHVLLAPIRSGKGTRYKILEAMATGTPIVATHLAVEGIGIQNNLHALVADTPEGLAGKTIQVLKNKKLQDDLAAKSRELVKRNYNWSTISKTLDTIYNILGKSRD